MPFYMHQMKKWILLIVISITAITISGILINKPITNLLIILSPFIIFIIILIILRLLRIPIHPGESFGESVKVEKHFLKSDKDNNRVSLTRVFRNAKIDEADPKTPIKVILGEFKGQDTIEYALNRGYDVEIITGPKTWEAPKGTLLELYYKHKDKLKIFILNTRPLRNSWLIGSNIMIEDPHGPQNTYESAIIIENANEYHLISYKTEFEHLKSSAKIAGPDEIRTMEMYKI